MVIDTANDGAARRVQFNPPLEANYMTVDGIRSGNCLVLNTGDDGALLEHVPPTLREFFLIFTSASAVRPVYRRCKRASIQGTKMDVDYDRTQPCFARHM
ncbi:hypothetical protein [Bradyrhizobium sp. Cp5.3]|uniref:hypothetical protein n=1 Tax=Bradyrhizobium sp. Cp5.3 TaxID=443598 RepID=UPI000552876F|nr:hypothetical protein [Bradyrhizobium sp. Cp5.3]